jgi:hypothetical protein
VSEGISETGEPVHTTSNLIHIRKQHCDIISVFIGNGGRLPPAASLFIGSLHRFIGCFRIL